MFCYHLLLALDVLSHTHSTITGPKVQRFRMHKLEYKNRNFKWKMCACIRYVFNKRMRTEMRGARERVPQFCQNRFVLFCSVVHFCQSLQHKI